MFDLLREALAELDNLQEYYQSQRDNVYQNVRKKMERYSYGIILDRFFLSKATENDEITISDKEQAIVDEILEEYKIDENSISFKLKEDVDVHSYEVNPQRARAEAIKLIQQPNILHDSMIMMLLVKYEESISGIFRYLLENNPKAYLANKSITYAELISIEAGLEGIKEVLIDKEIDEFMRKPISDWYKDFCTKHKVVFDYSEDEFETFKELYYRRNLIVHNQGIVNEIYQKNVPGSSAIIGERLQIDEDYLQNAFRSTRKIIIATFWGLRKFVQDKEEMQNYLFLKGYDSLVAGDWNLALFIICLLMKEKDQAESDRLCEQINAWIALKNRDGLDSIRDDVEKLDVSAMQAKFHIAKSALLNDNDQLVVLLENEINNEMPAWCIKEWPLLMQFRKTAQYEQFCQNHKEEFSEEGYEPDNEAMGNEEEILTELGPSYIEKR